MTNLEAFIRETPLVDSHEHLNTRETLAEEGPDIFICFFRHYLGADLACADRLLEPDDFASNMAGDPSEPFEERYARLEKAIRFSRHTSYARPIRQAAWELLGVEDFSLASFRAGQARLEELWGDGSRLRFFKEMGGIDHVQSDRWMLDIEPDSEDPAFFLYDLTVNDFTNCFDRNLAEIVRDKSGLTVDSFDSMKAALVTIFERNAARAIAIKSPHAYSRTIRWQKRSESEARAAFDRIWSNPEASTLEDQLCATDWNMGFCVELAIQHDLPVKIHTGYHAGSFRTHTDQISPGHLCDLLATYKQARFVLMHIGYPFEQEMIAVAKHFPNVWVDMCWAWSLNEQASRRFVRSFLSAVPYNKLFAFGGDTFQPIPAVGYARQARQNLSACLQEAIDDGQFNETEAVEIAGCLMLENQYDCFDVKGTQEAAISAASVLGS